MRPFSAESSGQPMRFYFQNVKMLFMLAVLFFLPFVINFLWGNHDWGWVKENTPLLSGVFEGRFSQFILQTVLFSGNILPIFTILSSLLIFSSAALLLLDMWNAPKRSLYLALLGINLVASPYTSPWLYFAFITLSCLSWPLAVIGAFKLLSRSSKPTHFFAAITLFTLSLGGYPPIINTIGVIFCTLALNNLCFDRFTPRSLIKKYTPAACSILISGILLLVIQHLLKKYGLQYNTYNTAGLTLSSLPEKLRLSASVAIKQFFITTSFIPFFYKYTTLFFVLLAFFQLFKKLPKSAANIFLFSILIVGMLFSSVITVFCAENTPYVLYEPRIDFFGLIYIYIYSAAVLLRSSSKAIKNLTLVLLFLLSFHRFNTIAFTSKVWILGMKAETNLAERTISRIESTPNFTPELSNYTFIQGGTISLRPKYYPVSVTEKQDTYTLTAPYIPWHLPTKAYLFYYPVNFVAEDFDVYWRFIPPHVVPQTEDYTRYLFHTAYPWPSPTALFINSSHIILTQTYEGRGAAQDWFDTHFPFYPH